jgi:hypothetical protein
LDALFFFSFHVVAWGPKQKEKHEPTAQEVNSWVCGIQKQINNPAATTTTTHSIDLSLFC